MKYYYWMIKQKNLPIYALPGNIDDVIKKKAKPQEKDRSFEDIYPEGGQSPAPFAPKAPPEPVVEVKPEPKVEVPPEPKAEPPSVPKDAPVEKPEPVIEPKPVLKEEDDKKEVKAEAPAVELNIPASMAGHEIFDGFQDQVKISQP